VGKKTQRYTAGDPQYSEMSMDGKTLRRRSSNRVADESAIRILTINSGSSSVKFSLYQMGTEESLQLSGIFGEIGQGNGYFHAKDAGNNLLLELQRNLPDYDAAFKLFFEWFKTRPEGKGLDAVGHRVVHGGSMYLRPEIVDDNLLTELDSLIPLAPDHLPQEISAIKEFRRAFPDLLQVACFDTAFHRSMPNVAQMFALPRELRQAGVTRYGFHGLSYEFILGELSKEAGAEKANGRVIIAHLGNGASMVAAKNRKSMDTTMGFTPAGGLVMSTRSGDLDPGVVLYLLKEKGMDIAAANRMINKQAGLLGVSGLSSDMKTLLDAETSDSRAAEAVELFCYQARKFVGALAAVLGGIDTLIFTGGIGENSPPIRERICKDLEFLGIYIDGDRNSESAPILSRDQSPVTVRVMKTNEELMIARHTYELIRKTGGSHEQKQ
jgi:acetate kinase